MLRQIIFFFITFLPIFASGQSLTNLDKNNGFRKFKFEMSPTQIKNIKKISATSTLNLRGVTYYTYTGSDILEFYSVKIEEIKLSFFNNRLYQIGISFGSIFRKYTDNEFSLANEALIVNFGHRTHDCKETSLINDKLDCLIWDAPKIRLEHVRMNLSEEDGTRKQEFNYVQGYILFNNKAIETEQQHSELEN